MICRWCNNEIRDCTCVACDLRLRRLADSPEAGIAFRWCRRCDKHQERCRCAEPDVVMIAGGKVSELR